MIKYAKLIDDDRNWVTCIIPETKNPDVEKFRMTFLDAQMFCFMYNENGEFGWRLPTHSEALNNDDLAGCWHQGDEGDPNLRHSVFYARPVKDV